MSDISFQKILKAIHESQDKITPLIEGLEKEIPQQSMKDYFVKLQIIIKEDEEKKYGNYENISGDKKEIELKNIFTDLSKEGPAAHKLLILGGAGIGKSTLLQYMAYKWGVGDLWNDRFDYVYRISLKTLLANHWKDDYDKSELREDILKCLVHYSLVTRMIDSGIEEPKLSEIYWPQDKDRILLLLDGYDEVAHLKKSTVNKDYLRLEKEIFSHKNFIFTSRPNAVDSQMKAQFDRTIENIGLDKAGLEQYFELYFKDKKHKGEELREFLTKNTSIREICKVPVNVALLCYIWSTGGSNNELKNISSASGLYKSVVDHLGQRYFSKEWSEDQKTVTLEEALKNGKLILDEFKVLTHVAYMGMTGGGVHIADEGSETLIIKGAHENQGQIYREDEENISIQSSINRLASHKVIKDDLRSKVTVGKVYKYGLLRLEGAVILRTDTDPHKQSYSFIHLTFQEYLTAYYFKERLKDEKVSQTEKREICQYIAQHRNEPRYLMVLKLLAGLITHDQSSEAEQTLKMFWDAMLCNVDGMIELGIGTKVTLLMHLLAQAKINGIIDSKIPNKKEAVMLVDAVVLNDLFSWRTQLKESDYMTDNIKEGIMTALAKGDLEWNSQRVENICENSPLPLQSAIRNMLKNKKNATKAKEGDKSESESLLGLAVDMAFDFLGKLDSNEQKVLLDRLKNIISGSIGEQWQLKLLTIEKIREYSNQLSLSFEDKQEIMKKLPSFLFVNNLKHQASTAIIDLSKTLNDIELASAVISFLDHIVQYKQSLNTKDQSSYWTAPMAGQSSWSSISHYRQQENLVIETLVNITELSKNKAVTVKVFNALLGPLGEGSSACGEAIKKLFPLIKDQEDVKKTIEIFVTNLTSNKIPIVDFNNLITTISDKDFIAEIIEHLTPFLIEDSTFKTVDRISVVQALFGSSKDPKLAVKAYNEILKPLKSPDSDILVRKANAIQAIIPVTKDKGLAIDAIEHLDCLLDDKSQSSNTYSVAAAAANATIQLAEMIQDVKMTTKLLERFTGLLDDPKASNIFYIITNLLKTAEGAWALDQINSLANQKSKEIRLSIITETIPNLIIFFKDQEIKAKLANRLENLLIDNDNTIKVAALRTIVEHPEGIKILQNKETKSNTIQYLLNFFVDQDESLRRAALNAIATLVNFVDGNTIAVLLEKTIALMNDGSQAIQMTAKNSLHWIVESLKHKLQDTKTRAQVIEQIMTIFASQDASVRKVAIDVALKLRESVDEKTAEILVDKITALFTDSSEEVRSAAGIGVAQTITILKGKELATKTTKHLISLFTIQDSKRRLSAIQAVHYLILTINDKDLAAQSIEKVKILFADEDLEVRLQASVTFATCSRLIGEPELMTQAVKQISPYFTEENMTFLTEVLSSAKKLSIMMTDKKPLNEILEQTMSTLASQDTQFKYSIATRMLMIAAIMEDRDFAVQAIEYFNLHILPLSWTKIMFDKSASTEPLVQALSGALKVVGDSQLTMKCLGSLDEVCSYDANGLDLITIAIRVTVDKELAIRLANAVDIGNYSRMTGDAAKATLSAIFGTFTLPLEKLMSYINTSYSYLRTLIEAKLKKSFVNYLTKFTLLDEMFNHPHGLDLDVINEQLFEGNLEKDLKDQFSTLIKEYKKNSNPDCLEDLKDKLRRRLDRLGEMKGPELIVLVLKILDHGDPKNSGKDKEIVDIARKILDLQVKHVNIEALEWVNCEFETLISVSSESKPFMKKLYHKLLEDSTITDLKERLIIKFINYGLTTSFSVDGKIILEGKRYKVQAKNNVQFLEPIAREVINQEIDVLASQYKEHKPMFPKSTEFGMKKAAADIEKIYSAVEKSQELTTNEWFLVKLSKIEDKEAPVFLLEQRRALGDHLIYRLNISASQEHELIRIDPACGTDKLGEIFGKYVPGRSILEVLSH